MYVHPTCITQTKNKHNKQYTTQSQITTFHGYIFSLFSPFLKIPPGNTDTQTFVIEYLYKV